MRRLRRQGSPPRMTRGAVRGSSRVQLHRREAPDGRMERLPCQRRTHQPAGKNAQCGRGEVQHGPYEGGNGHAGPGRGHGRAAQGSASRRAHPALGDKRGTALPPSSYLHITGGPRAEGAGARPEGGGGAGGLQPLRRPPRGGLHRSAALDTGGGHTPSSRRPARPPHPPSWPRTRKFSGARTPSRRGASTVLHCQTDSVSAVRDWVGSRVPNSSRLVELLRLDLGIEIEFDVACSFFFPP